MNDWLKDIKVETSDEEPCNGRVYRARINSYIGSKGEIVYKEALYPMKRLSCSGCPACHYMDETLSEYVSNDYLPIMEEPIEDGALYCLAIVNEYRDWETGIVEDFDLVWRKVSEND